MFFFAYDTKMFLISMERTNSEPSRKIRYSGDDLLIFMRCYTVVLCSLLGKMMVFFFILNELTDRHSGVQL